MSFDSHAHAVDGGLRRLIAGASSVVLLAALLMAGAPAGAVGPPGDQGQGPPEGVPGSHDDDADDEEGGEDDDRDGGRGRPGPPGDLGDIIGLPDDIGPPEDVGPPFGPPVEGDPAGITRISGVNRYDTSVSLSQYTHPDGADEVFIATGGGFADALASGPAAAAVDAPVLFSPSGNLHQPVAGELLRLDPETVTVVGGPAVVQPRIIEQVNGLLGGDDGTGVTVQRFAGADRFGTAAAISQATHPDGAEQVYLATGGRFPDALAGGPIAASLDAPVLLATSGSLPETTTAEVQRLDPETVTVMGGPGAITDDVLDEVRDLTGAGVQRIAGDDRFDTAVAASQFLASQQETSTAGSDAETSTVYVATGLGWADALAGAAAAGSDSAPVLLTTPGQLPGVVEQELQRLDPDEVVVLGGPGAVTSKVAGQVQSALDGAGQAGDDWSGEDDWWPRRGGHFWWPGRPGGDDDDDREAPDRREDDADDADDGDDDADDGESDDDDGEDG